MTSNPTREHYLSIDNTDPLDLPDFDGDGADSPDAPLPYHYGEPGRAEGVLSGGLEQRHTLPRGLASRP